MAHDVSRARIVFRDHNGSEIGASDLFGSKTGDTISILTEEEAKRTSEEPIQIFEATPYEYETVPLGYRLALSHGIGALKPSRNPGRLNCGFLELGSYVGRLQLRLVDLQDQTVGTAALEVRSKKIGYRNHFQQMMELITDRAAELVLDVRSPTTARAIPDGSRDAKSIYQQFAFLSGLLENIHFKNAVSYLLSRPHHDFDSLPIDADTCRGMKSGRQASRNIARARSRLTIPSHHPLSRTIKSLPIRIPRKIANRSFDNPENQFVRFALEQFSRLVDNLRSNIVEKNRSEHVRLIEEANRLTAYLDGVRSSRIFQNLSRLQRIPLDSTLLQRREGYREVLKAWLKFNLAARLVWDGASDFYDLGQRDLAALYEYWVFFVLLDIVRTLFDLESTSVDSLFEETGDHLGLRLKRGRNLALRGSKVFASIKVNMRFDFNRTFTRRFAIGVPGSWTESMRPDYTLSMWTGDVDEQSASETGAIVHLHFDAKYRVESLVEVFGPESGENSSSSGEFPEKQYTHKRVDLLKMHAYRDAIRRSYGAYVLYPGETEKCWAEYHELLPGLGAFSLRPGSLPVGLHKFLQDVVSHVAHRSIRDDLAKITASEYLGTASRVL